MLDRRIPQILRSSRKFSRCFTIMCRHAEMAHSVSDIVRLPLSVLQSDPKSFVTAMEERGFVVLCEIGKGEEVHAEASVPSLPAAAFSER